MRHTRWIEVLLLSAFASSLNATMEISVQHVDATTGSAAKGVIMREESDILELTTTPCLDDAHKKIVVFRWPYRKTPTDSISCGPKTYDQFIVQQD